MWTGLRGMNTFFKALYVFFNLLSLNHVTIAKRIHTMNMKDNNFEMKRRALLTLLSL